MNRSEVIEKVKELMPKHSKRVIEAMVYELFDSMGETLSSGDRIEIRGFGSFCTREREAGLVRNPRLGKQMNIAKRKVVYFRAGKELSARVDVVKKTSKK